MAAHMFSLAWSPHSPKRKRRVYSAKRLGTLPASFTTAGVGTILAWFYGLLSLLDVERLKLAIVINPFASRRHPIDCIPVLDYLPVSDPKEIIK